MNIQLIQEEVFKIKDTSYAQKSDKQLISYENLSELYKGRNKGVQPAALIKYNKVINRSCKLTIEKVNEIRSRYIPHVYGKDKLAKEYGVSTSVVYRILIGKSWKVENDSS